MTDLESFDKSGLGPLLDRLSDGLAIALSSSWRVLYANPVLADWLGKRTDELRDAALEELFRPDCLAEVLEHAGRVCQGAPGTAAVRIQLRGDDPDLEVADVRLCRIVVGEQVLLGVVVRRGARGPRGTSKTTVRRDPLTGLADRQFLIDRLAALLRGGRAADRRFAVLFVDLDNFKQVNDAHGHLIGDRVLREVARRLEGCVRDGDHVVRFGGDEFVVLAEGVAGPSETQPIVHRIHAALARPIALPEGEFTLSLSIGVAQAAPDHQSPDELLRDADQAMYAAKGRA